MVDTINLTQFEKRCVVINKLFNELTTTNSRVLKESIVTEFRNKYPKLCTDLDFCFEVLAGKHKLGYTYILDTSIEQDEPEEYAHYTIKSFVGLLKSLPATDEGKLQAIMATPISQRLFIYNLVNREFRLGFSNKEAMVKHYSPMLAKRYPDTVHEQEYFIQEKLDGNRCIAYYNYEAGQWVFMSRSGKPLKVDFDMSWAQKYDVFDGEVMTLGHAGSRDFNRTSGAINGKFTDKSMLHYYIYDLVDETLSYTLRKAKLDSYDKNGVSSDCTILPVLDKITVYVNTAYNYKLDSWLDFITSKGGEGIMLRDPNATYQCGKRSDALLKYKKVQTMDLRIIDWNEGNGKYAGEIGSFVCETDDHSIRVSVSGMPDAIHYSNPADWIGKIIEVAYFDISKSSANDYSSLRFPRLKRIRNDKNTTSIY